MAQEDEALALFCSITGADESAAGHFLEASGGDVQVAVGLFMDSNGKAAPGPRESLPQSPVEDDVRRPIAPTRGVLVDDDEGGYVQPTAHWVDPRAMAGRRPTTVPFASFTDSVDLTTERGRRLAQLFKIPQEIMFVGTLDAGRKLAKNQQRYLLITLHEGSEFICQTLNRDLWNQESVQEFVSSNLVFMQPNTATEEGERYMRLYAVAGHPHIALIDPRTGKSVKIWSRTPSPAELIGDIIEFTERHPLKANRPEPVVISDDETEEGAEETAEKVQESVSLMPDEPAADASNVTTVQFHMPDGKRVRRRFVSTDQIAVLFAFVSASLQLPPSRIDIVETPRSLRELAQDSTLADAGIKNSALKVVTI